MTGIPQGFAALLPQAAVVSETGRTPPALRVEGAHSDELALVAAAAPVRRAEFLEARALAHEALRRLGRPASSILKGARGEPLWPEGVVGSITHSEGHRAVVVALSREIASVGIDVEPHAPLPEGVLDVIAIPEDRFAMTHGERVLFSAKESVYKAWFPLTGLWLDFHEVAVELRADGSFAARILRDPSGVDDDAAARPAPHVMEGRWSVEGGLIRTAVTVPGHRRCGPGGEGRPTGRSGLPRRV